jgi:hypothetical protein
MQFYKSEIEKEVLIARIRKNPSLYNIFKKNKDVTTLVDEDIRQRTKGEIDNFFTIIMSGNQGTQKSSVAQEISVDNDKKFSSHNIVFSYQELKEKLENSKKGDIFILDEEIAIFGVGSGRVVSAVQNMVEMLRQHGASMIFISPDPKYFNENLFTYHLETIDRSILGTCSINKKHHEIRTCTDNKHENIRATVRCAVKKEGEYIGFYIKPIKWNTKLWQEYTTKKKEFLKKVLADDFQKLDYEKIAFHINQDPDSQYNKTNKQWMLYLEKKYPNLSVGEKQLICAQLSINKKKGLMP